MYTEGISKRNILLLITVTQRMGCIAYKRPVGHLKSPEACIQPDLHTQCNSYILMWWMIDSLYSKYAHSSIQHNIKCNRNVFTNFLPCSHAINPNNEACLVTCAESLTCATWLMYAQVFLWSNPQPGYKYSNVMEMHVWTSTYWIYTYECM